MVVVIVCMVGNGFPTDVTKMIVIAVDMVGNRFSAYVALMVGVVVLMRAGVCTDGADTVFKLVVGFRNSYLAAAVPLLCMLGFGPFPDFLARVVFGVRFAVCFTADFANCFVLTGRRPAGVGTGIFANGANAVFKGMRLFLHRNLAAAKPFLGVHSLVAVPGFLARVVFGVQFAICFAAYFAYCFVLAGCAAAGVGGDGFTTNIANVVVVLIRVVGNGFAADITKVVFIAVHMIGNSLATDVANVIVVTVNMVGNDFSTSVANVVGVFVYVV